MRHRLFRRVLLVAIYVLAIHLMMVTGMPTIIDTPIEGQNAIGSILNDRYKLLQWLGRGGFSSVYKAEDMHNSGNYVAVKISFKGEEADFKYNEDEARILRELCPSGGIVNLLDDFPCGSGQHCIVLELMSCDLSTVSRKMISSGSIYSRLIKIQKVARDILPEIAKLHRKGIVHADIKVENILYSEETDSFKLNDFGLAFREMPGLVVSLRGTPAYISPEAYISDHLSKASDIWAFALTLLNTYLQLNVFDVNLKNFHQELAKKWELWLGPLPIGMRAVLIENVQFDKNLQDGPETSLLRRRLATTDSSALRDFIDLLEKCFNYSPKHRLTAEQALMHPFVRNEILPGQDVYRPAESGAEPRQEPLEHDKDSLSAEALAKAAAEQDSSSAEALAKAAAEQDSSSTEALAAAAAAAAETEAYGRLLDKPKKKHWYQTLRNRKG